MHHNDRVVEILEKISDRINEMEITLARNTVSLEEHMRRTEALEKQVEPIKKHVAHVEGALKVMGALGVIAGIILGVLKLLV